MGKAIEDLSPDEIYGYCRKLEDDREVTRLRYLQGRFHVSLLSIDKLFDSFDDPSEIALLSDGDKTYRKMFLKLDAEYYKKVVKSCRKYRKELQFKAALHRLRKRRQSTARFCKRETANTNFML